MSNSMFNDFFNPQVKLAETNDSGNSNLFKPNPKKGQNGVFTACIRFLPSPIDPANKSIISKFSVYLTHPRTNEKREIDCPSTVGQPSILTNTFFALKNSPNPILQENSKQFSRRQRFASLIQVLSCPSNPNLENKILIWQFGYKINEKIIAEMNPPMGEPKNPFNIITGRPFAVKVKEVGGFPNYDACGFFDLDINQSGMRIQVPNATGQMNWMVVTQQTLSTEQGQQAVIDYLKTNAPDMTPYEYHPWDEATTTFVNECVQIYSNPQATVQAVSSQTTMSNMGATPYNGTPSPAVPNMPNQPMEMPSAPQMNMGVSMPTMGAAPSIGQPSPTMTMPPVGNGFADSANIPSGLEDVLNANAAADTPKTGEAPSMGLSLDDVLSGQMA